MFIISSILRRMACIILAAGVPPQLLPEFFKALKLFLTDEPKENFTQLASLPPTPHIPEKETLKLIPLNMNATAEESLRTKFQQVDKSLPAVIDNAKAGENFVNFLHILGQILSTSVTLLDKLEFTTEDIETKNQLQKTSEKLYDIWGGHDNLNAKSLVREFAKRSNEDTRKEILQRLDKSTQAAEKILLVSGLVKEPT